MKAASSHRIFSLTLSGVMALAVTIVAVVCPPRASAINFEPMLKPAVDCEVGTSRTIGVSLGERPNSNQIMRVKVKKDLVMEKMIGDAALNHLLSLKSRRPGAFKAAEAALRGRGFEPTSKIYVERVIRLDDALLPAQDYSESNDEGEIVFWSWDNGDDSTWQGTIYHERYDTGEAGTWEGQVDVSTEEYPWIYANLTWRGNVGPGGGDPPSADHVIPERNSVAGNELTFAVIQDDSPVYGSILEAGFIDEWAECFRGCVVTGCSTAAFYCLFTDGAWWACFGQICSSVEIGCALGCAF